MSVSGKRRDSVARDIGLIFLGVVLIAGFICVFGEALKYQIHKEAAQSNP